MMDQSKFSQAMVSAIEFLNTNADELEDVFAQIRVEGFTYTRLKHYAAHAILKHDWDKVNPPPSTIRIFENDEDDYWKKPPPTSTAEVEEESIINLNQSFFDEENSDKSSLEHQQQSDGEFVAESPQNSPEIDNTKELEISLDKTPEDVSAEKSILKNTSPEQIVITPEIPIDFQFERSPPPKKVQVPTSAMKKMQAPETPIRAHSSKSSTDLGKSTNFHKMMAKGKQPSTKEIVMPKGIVKLTDRKGKVSQPTEEMILSSKDNPSKKFGVPEGCQTKLNKDTPMGRNQSPMSDMGDPSDDESSKTPDIVAKYLASRQRQERDSDDDDQKEVPRKPRGKQIEDPQADANNDDRAVREAEAKGVALYCILKESTMKTRTDLMDQLWGLIDELPGNDFVQGTLDNMDPAALLFEKLQLFLKSNVDVMIFPELKRRAVLDIIKPLITKLHDYKDQLRYSHLMYEEDVIELLATINSK